MAGRSATFWGKLRVVFCLVLVFLALGFKTQKILAQCEKDDGLNFIFVFSGD